MYIHCRILFWFLFQFHKRAISIMWPLLWVLFAQSVAGAEGVSNPELLQRFKDEAPMAWKKANELSQEFYRANKGWEAKGIQTWIEDPAKRRKKSDFQFSTKRLGLTHRIIVGTDKLKVQETVECANPLYAFSLLRGMDGWVITGVYPASSKQTDKDVGSDSERKYAKILSEPLPLDADKIVTALKSEEAWEWISQEVEIQDAMEVDFRGRPCVRVSIKFPKSYYEERQGTNILDKVEYEAEGVAIFDPENLWTVLDFRFRVPALKKPGKPHWETRYELEYQFTPEGVPLIAKKRSLAVDLSTNGIRNDHLYEVDHSFAKIAPEAFTLTAFGLPEPSFINPPYWLYTSLGGIVLVVSGALLYRWGVGLRKS